MLMLSMTVFAGENAKLVIISPTELPSQAVITLNLIKQGGPFPYPKDGITFGNYEANLPKQKRGYYREYTVPTPRVKSRGARRIVTGGSAPSKMEFFYTDDHYQSFKQIKE